MEGWSRPSVVAVVLALMVSTIFWCLSAAGRSRLLTPCLSFLGVVFVLVVVAAAAAVFASPPCRHVVCSPQVSVM